MKPLRFMTIALLFAGCRTAPVSNEQQERQVSTIHIRADLQRMQKHLENPCDTFSYEFGNLYPILDTLPSITEDTLIMDNYLKDRGFTVSSGGHGNWQQGPRLITLELAKGECSCRVYKKYYYNDSLEGGAYNLRVTEKVVCNTENDPAE